ncbi:MAG: transporter substrate-binding domain-containing protein [Marinobacter sp.]|nr:transporter substrate-binding domain-containing protein [Marinobacter sp.]
MRLAQTLLAASLAFALAPPLAHARSPEVPEILHLNVSPQGYPPYTIVQKGEPIRGIVWDVVSVIGERLGFSVEAHQIPRKRVDSMIMAGTLDATPRAREWSDDPDNFLFTKPIVAVREVFFSLADNPFHYETPADLKGYTVVGHLGYRYPHIEAMFASGEATRINVSRDIDLFTFLLNGNFNDVAVADRTVGQWIIRENGWQGQFNYSHASISDIGLRLMVRPDYAEFVAAFDRELEALINNGKMEQILDRYR